MVKNLEKINILKKEKINKGLEFLEKNDNNKSIKKVIIFGSSVRNDCTENSDIDICFVTDSNCSDTNFFNIYGRLPLIMDNLCDIVIWNKIDTKLKKEIKNKGVVVYEL